MEAEEEEKREVGLETDNISLDVKTEFSKGGFLFCRLRLLRLDRRKGVNWIAHSSLTSREGNR